MRMTLDQLTRMRMAGKRPESWVIVSMIGHLDDETDAVIAMTQRPEQADWRSLVDLPVVVFYRSDTHHESVMETLNSIIRVNPNHLACWMTDRAIGVDLVDCGSRVFRRWDARLESEWERIGEASHAHH